MKASETNLEGILEGKRQYQVPLYQRVYSWGPKQIDQLWDDLIEIAEADHHHARDEPHQFRHPEGGQDDLENAGEDDGGDEVVHAVLAGDGGDHEATAPVRPRSWPGVRRRRRW